ncbi:MAG: BatA domain-containing protein [Pirellulales bacterium]
MTFINPMILAGLAGISIPIIIHLLNRRKAKVVEWGAMRFLSGSLVSRRRRVQIEEMILLALRCLLMALIALAVARPFTPVGSSFSWVLMLPLMLLAAVLVAVATVISRQPRWRWLMYATAVGILVMAAVATQLEKFSQIRRWSQKGQQDVAMVIDASTSMTLMVDGKSNFDHAVEECRSLIQSMGNSNGVSIILAGSAPRVVTPSPLSNAGDLSTVLDGLKPIGGSLALVDALGAAAETLARGDNAAKKIVVITDGQSVGWDTNNLARWEFLATTLSQLSTEPKIVCRTLSMPVEYRNAAVASIDISRDLVGTDRPVAISVRIENTGTDTIEPEGVELNIGGERILTQPIGLIPAGASEQVRFTHRFQRGGPYVLKSRVLVNDDVPGDDTLVYVMRTETQLPVLLVDGHARSRTEDQATAFIELALAPPFQSEDEGPSRPDPDGDKLNGAAAYENQRLITTRVIAAPDLDERVDFGEYRVVVLASVPRLSASVAERLTQFVQQGGGLLITPNSDCEMSFYNQWKTPDGRTFLPASLVERRAIGAEEEAARPAIDTFRHMALQHLAKNAATDIDTATFTAYWKLEIDTADDGTVAGANLDSGDLLLAEREVGKGRVMMTSVAFDDVNGNLPSLLSFLPMVHQLVYHLSMPEIVELNFKPGAFVKLRLPLTSEKAKEKPKEEELQPESDKTDAPVMAEVITPGDKTREATIEIQDDTLLITVLGTVESGAYRLKLPKRFAAALKGFHASGTESTAASSKTGGDSDRTKGANVLPFAVATLVEESRLTRVTTVEEATAQQYTNFFLADSSENMIAAVKGDIPGNELWKIMACGALLVVIAESFVARWIAVNRKTGSADTVSFISEGQRVNLGQARAKEMVKEMRAKSKKTSQEKSATTTSPIGSAR